MSTTVIPGRGPDAPDDRRRSAPAEGARRAPDPPETNMPTTTFPDQLAAAERARHARLRRLWQMSPEQRLAAMRRGELTREQLAAWSSRHPDQIPIVNGEFEYITMHTPEACE